MDSPRQTWSSYVPFFDDSGRETIEGDLEKGSPFTAKTRSTAEPTVREQLRTFWALSAPYFSERREARYLFGGLILLMLLNGAATIVFSYLARDFWSALGDKDADQFYAIMRNFLVALCLLAPINVLYVYQRQRLAIQWRQWMTERMLSLYLHNPNRIYYRLEHYKSSAVGGNLGKLSESKGDNHTNDDFVDNPDQRMADDIRSFTQYSLSIFLTIAVSLIDLTAFSIILYTIEPMLFVSIVAFATFGTAATCLLGKDLVRLNFRRLAFEADFRYSLVRLRENAESIAFFHGETKEGDQIQNRFLQVLTNAYQVIRTERNLGFFTTSYNYLTWILPVVVVAPEYMAGDVELGVVQQAAAAFGHVLNDLSLIINEFQGLAEFSASIGRLHQFVTALKTTDPDRRDRSDEPLLGCPSFERNEKACQDSKSPGDSDGIFRTTWDSESRRAEDSVTLTEFRPTGSDTTLPPSSIALSIRNLTLCTPGSPISGTNNDNSQIKKGRRLIRLLNLDLQWGDKLLIIGPSGIGKSSLLRAVAGLWTSGSGEIARAHTSDVYFLPQKPYCPVGSLRDQLLYPGTFYKNGSLSSTSTEIGEDPLKLLEFVRKVDLAHLIVPGNESDQINSLDVTLDWSNVLSLGEQQRLAFARVLIHRPKLLVLDEATSAMDVQSEKKMYSLLEETTCVSVGHRPTLLQYHNRLLQLHKPMTSLSGGTRCGDDSSAPNYTLRNIHSTADEVISNELSLFFR